VIVYQLLAQGRWFFPASATTKTGRYEIAEIHCIAESGIKTPKNQSINHYVLIFRL
jgi:hypothetical protein